MPKPHAPNTNENVALGFALKQHIMECFEPGLQAMRLEHKSTESLISGLRQEMQRATDEICVSCQRMESEVIQCHALLNDVVRQHCVPPEHSQTFGLNGAGSQMLGHDGPRHASGRPMPTPDETHALVDNQSPSTNDVDGLMKDSTERSIQAQMLDKIESEERKKAEAKRLVESYLSCYHDRCVPSMLVRFVHSLGFNNCSALITVVFAIAVGIEADLHIRAALDGKNCPTWIEKAVGLFNIWFVAEVTLRILADGIHYFLEADWRWNLFDFVIGVLSLVDMIAGTGSFGFLRMLRALKIAKALRVVRLLRMFHDLRLLIASMLSSLASLIWSMVFLVMVIYLVAVALLQATAIHVHDNYGKYSFHEIQELYSSLSKAMYTLFMSITGGIDWSDAASPVWHVGWFYGGVFLGYILFCLLGILNVTTSIFVERASNMKKHDRDYAVAEELRTMEEDIEATMGVFQTLTGDGVREIKTKNLMEILKEKRVIAHFASIGIEISDRAFITHALGDNVEGGVVDTRAFVRGCFSLRGVAKQSDTFAIISHVKKVEAVLEDMREFRMRTFTGLAQFEKEFKAAVKHNQLHVKQVEAALEEIKQERFRTNTMLAHLEARSGQSENDDHRAEFEAAVRNNPLHVPLSNGTQDMRTQWKV